MRQRCEICENFRPDTEFEGDRNTVLIAFGERRVLLCAGHLKIARNSGVTTFEGLRAFYGSGRRSFVPRREPTLTVGNYERQGRGRRATDQRSR